MRVFPSIKKEYSLLLYKWMAEVFFLVLVGVFGFCVSEIILPGLLSTHISWFEVAVVITFSAFLWHGSAVLSEMTTEATSFVPSTRFRIGTGIFVTLLVLSDMRDVGWWQGIFLAFLVFSSVWALLLALFPSLPRSREA